MMVQLLGLHASTTGGLGSMPSQGTNPANSGKDKKKNRPQVSHMLILPTSSSLFEPFHFHSQSLMENIALR